MFYEFPSLLSGMINRLDSKNNYKILGKFSSGGMGEIYQAFDKKNQKTVVIKFLFKDLMKYPNVLRRFYREVDCLQKIGGKFSPAFYDFVEYDDGERIGFVMDLLGGHDLKDDENYRNGTFDKRVLEICGDLAKKIDDLSVLGITHRDIKSENVRLVGEKIYLLDYGIAFINPNDQAFEFKHLESLGLDGNSRLTLSCDYVGTPEIVAPEVITGNCFGVRSELYSLGVMMYHLISGKNLFVGSPEILKSKPLTEIPVAPSEVRKNWKSSLDDICLRLLEKYPPNRFASGEDLVIAMEKAIK